MERAAGVILATDTICVSWAFPIGTSAGTLVACRFSYVSYVSEKGLFEERRVNRNVYSPN